MSDNVKHVIAGILGAAVMGIMNHFTVSAQLDTHVNNSVQEIENIVSIAVQEAVNQ